MPSAQPLTNGHSHTNTYDVLIIGAGFGGCYSLYKLRELGLNAHVFEAGSYLGGVWHWSTYPGARVDSEIPYYQFSMPEVWRKWNWSERFPGREEIKVYFKHVDHTLRLSKDVTFDATVNRVERDEARNRWKVWTENGIEAECTYLICATGSSYKPNFPNFKDMHKFKGQLVHSCRYPANPNTKGTRVAVIGAGATGVQCTQEIAKEASQLTVYIRTASISLPMFQRPLTEFEQRTNKSMYAGLFARCKQTKSGLGYDQPAGSVFDLNDEEREELWEHLWERGGFNFNQANYRDFLVDPKANEMMYRFWAKKTGPRLKNLEKRAFLVPDKAPFAFGTKRSSLEQDYYECLDQDNVDIVDLKANPIERFTETGIVGRDGVERHFDTIVLATGFDAMTGSLTSMNLRGKDGLTIQERWKDGVFTHLGMCIDGCPNLFMVYGPQAPTAFTNGPTFIEAQVEVVVDFIKKLRSEGIRSIEAQREAEVQWKQAIQDANNKTLLPLTDSWYMGANIPGKPREQLNYLGGIQQYIIDCREALEDLRGFTVVYN
ncbi:cyclopentanone monooxygenase [Neohortaea acidophila]|uniref:Cyclopentanone monooxygenase n=1 Tax=Neohortaea acidophila TaxID=245834 RepID=A0A6A6PY51_9PEZI|nr:cyclopentanone monooxygenase [Neohortaea acidophila]KAF2484915.1 cyclopentanone monooxygenase [Neohortaea acidophila]